MKIYNLIDRKFGWKNFSTCFLALIAMIFSMSLIDNSLQIFVEDQVAIIHLMIELFSIIVSLLVVSISWQSLDGRKSDLSNIFIFGFTCIAGIDLIHSFSFIGMPNFLDINSTAQAIFFWLAARYIELAVLVLIVFRVALPGSSALWQVLGLTVIFAIVLSGVQYHESLSVFFIPGQGVTHFKAALEYILCISNVSIGVFLLSRSAVERSLEDKYLGMASFIAGIGELAFTGYVETSDLINFIGHSYKIISYVYIYKGIFSNRMRRPYLELSETKEKLYLRESELKALVENVPLGIARLDVKLCCRYINPVLEKALGKKNTEAQEKHISDLIPFDVFANFKPFLKRAIRGERVTFSYNRMLDGGIKVFRLVSIVPEKYQDNKIFGVAMIFTDVTDLELAHEQIISSLKEVTELKAALNAHAIVAITDSRGVITEVNDKFCDISKYSREELIGNTHRVINSGFHPKEFFKDLWDTISRGSVWHGEICNKAKDGSLYWVYTTIVPFVSSDGSPNQYIAIRADITSRKLAEQEARMMAMHDALTGLPNRRMMTDSLQTAIARVSRSNCYGGFLLLDLDKFKSINDTFGHAAGDQLLCEVALRLRNSVRQTDTVARLGGDEFVVILNDLGDDFSLALSLIRNISEKIRQELSTNYVLLENVVASSPSIGATIFHKEISDVDEIIMQADKALYRSKENGRNTFAIFEEF